MLEKNLKRMPLIRWASRWRYLCASEEYGFYLFADSKWYDDAKNSGLKIDMFKPIEEKFPGIDFYSIDGLKQILPRINEPSMLGNFILTMCYRVFKSEGYFVPDREWFILAFDRLIELLKKQ